MVVLGAEKNLRYWPKTHNDTYFPMEVWAHDPPHTSLEASVIKVTCAELKEGPYSDSLPLSFSPERDAFV